MNLKQIWCSVKTFGCHIENYNHPECTYGGDHHCFHCKLYLFSDYDSEASRKEMRNAAKMWWETKE